MIVSGRRPRGPDVGGHEHEPADLDLESAGIVFRDVPPDQLQGFLDRFLAVLRRLVDADFRVMDVADQLAEGPPGDAPQQVEEGELDRRQRRADGDSVVPEVEAVDEDLLHEEIQVPRVLADEERLQVVDEERVEHLQPAVPHREAHGAVARAHSAQEAVSEPQQLEALDHDGRGEQRSLQHRLPEDLVQLRVTGVRLAGEGIHGVSGSRQRSRHATEKAGLDEATSGGHHAAIVPASVAVRPMGSGLELCSPERRARFKT